ncbi:U-box domain-containing protein 6 [Striga asiatica]|uniref:U-box domain-containing protein 6 n=1 Tax=Striga asiatica TaxID=4170 RepID=A0A5A7PM97_STRAF|nr:U-box domain-containing protein 6 [Striga asiatica]
MSGAIAYTPRLIEVISSFIFLPPMLVLLSLCVASVYNAVYVVDLDGNIHIPFAPSAALRPSTAPSPSINLRCPLPATVIERNPKFESSGHRHRVCIDKKVVNSRASAPRTVAGRPSSSSLKGRYSRKHNNKSGEAGSEGCKIGILLKIFGRFCEDFV